MALFLGLQRDRNAADMNPKRLSLKKKPKAKTATAPDTKPLPPTYITDYDIVGDIVKVDDKSITIRVTSVFTPPRQFKCPRGSDLREWNHGTSGQNPHGHVSDVRC